MRISWDSILNFDGETGPFVQYSHARACSLLRKAGFDQKNRIVSLAEESEIGALEDESAEELLKQIIRFPDTIERSIREHQVCYIAWYAIEVAKSFNRFYNSKKIISIPQIKDALIPRIVSKLELPAKKKLIVSIKTDRMTNYNLYIQTLDQVRTAYAEVKDQVSQDMFNMRYKDLADEQQKEVKAKVYEIISIAEPEQVK